MPLPLQVNWSGHDLELWPLTLKTFSAMPTHMMNICGKFHWNSCTKYGDIASRKIHVNRQTVEGGTTTRAALLENIEASAELSTAMAERLLRAQPDSVASHITDRSISDRHVLTWLATETCWAQSKTFAICSGKLISGYMISYDVNRRYDM